MPAIANRYDLLCTRLDRFTRTLHGVDKGQVSAVHHARVASRRLRELLPILQLDSAVSRRLGHRLRRVTKRLGVVRELDVLLQLMEELCKSDRNAERALRRVAAEVREARDEARGKVSGKRAAGELRRVARKLEKVSHRIREFEQDHRGDRAWRWVIAARVARRAAMARSAIEHAGPLYLQERLHAARITVKKLRYALELSEEAVGGSSDDLKALKRGQTTLGRMHDLQMLIDRVRRVQATIAPAEAHEVSHELDVLVTTLDGACRRLHGRYVRDRETLLEICRRLAARTPAPSRIAKLLTVPKLSGVRRAG